MSLIVYDPYCEKETVPEIIQNNDAYFNLHSSLRDTDLVCKALLDIDNAERRDSQTFWSTAFSNDKSVVNKEYLSTGCKTAINIILHPDRCFSIIECGKNASWWILQLNAGCIYLPFIQLRLPETAPCDIIYCNKHFTEAHLFTAWRHNNV